MPERSGIATQLGVAEESTYGTFVTPARFVEMVDENVNLTIGRDESKGLRSGQRYLRTDHWQAGKRAAAGPIDLEIANKGFGLLFKHCGGNVATVADGTGKKHTITPASLFGLSTSWQVGRPDVSGTVQPFSYTGCKVAQWQIDQQLDAFAMLKLTLDAQDESTAQSLGSATPPAETELFHWHGFTLTVNGSAYDQYNFSVAGQNSLKTDRYRSGNRLKKEPIEHQRRSLTGSLTSELIDLTAYARFAAGTVVPIVATWVADTTYDTAKPFKMILTLNNCRFDGTTPGVKNEDVVEQVLPFTVLDDGTLPVWQIDYFTSDATP